jgi:hypothetical protein
MRYLVAFAAAITASLLALNFMGLPFAWISLIWLLASAYVAITATRPAVKLAAFYPGLISIAYGAGESYLWYLERPSVQNLAVVTDGFSRPHDILGWAPTKAMTASAVRQFRGELIHDVSYSIGVDGLRVSSNGRTKENAAGSVVFFGCSFTFGDGLHDEETMPYLVAAKTGGTRVHNFAFSGYGAHQMLAALEHGLVEEVVSSQPSFGLYQGMLKHVDRSGGLVDWGRAGPRYALASDGVTYVGQFDPDDHTIGGRLKDALIKSRILKHMIFARPDSDDVDLFIAIVDKARTRFETLFPGSEFHVLFWDETENKHNRKVLDAFRARKIRVHLMTEIFQNIDRIRFINWGVQMTSDGIDQMQYVISKYDRHPSALANQIIADYVATRIIGR